MHFNVDLQLQREIQSCPFHFEMIKLLIIKKLKFFEQI